MSLRLEVACELAPMRRIAGETSNVRPSTKEGIESYVGVPSSLQAYPFDPEVGLS